MSNTNSPRPKYLKLDVFIFNYTPIKSFIYNTDKKPYFTIAFQVSFSALSSSFFNIYLITKDNEGKGFVGLEPNVMDLKDPSASYLFNRKLIYTLDSLVSNEKTAEVYVEITSSNQLRIVGDYNRLI